MMILMLFFTKTGITLVPMDQIAKFLCLDISTCIWPSAEIIKSVKNKGSIGPSDDKTNGSPGRPFIPRNRLKFGKAARIMFSLLLTLLTAPKDILNHD